MEGNLILIKSLIGIHLWLLEFLLIGGTINIIYIICSQMSMVKMEILPIPIQD